MERIYYSEEKNLMIVTHGCALGYIVAWWMKFEMHMLNTSYFSASPGSITYLFENKYKQLQKIVNKELNKENDQAGRRINYIDLKINSNKNLTKIVFILTLNKNKFIVSERNLSLLFHTIENIPIEVISSSKIVQSRYVSSFNS